MEAERRQALKQWLQKVPDDPGGLLRRKFEYEYRKRVQEYERTGRLNGIRQEENRL